MWEWTDNDFNSSKIINKYFRRMKWVHLFLKNDTIRWQNEKEEILYSILARQKSGYGICFSNEKKKKKSWTYIFWLVQKVS